MKKWILYPVIIFVSLILLFILIVGGVLFYKPTTLVNPKNIDYLLKRADILKSYSWKDAEINHKWVKWNERIIDGHFKDLCFEYENQSALVKSCFEEVSWNFILTFSAQGAVVKTIDPFKLRSKETYLAVKKNDEPKDETLPDIYGYWQLLWSEMIPDLDFDFTKVRLKLEKEELVSEFKLLKKPKGMEAGAFDFKLFANPKGFEVTHPKPYKVPSDMKLARPIYIRDIKLIGDVSKNKIPLKFRGLFEVIPFGIDTILELPVKDDFSSVAFQKKIILKTTAFVNIESVKKTLSELGPGPYNKLPAPLNIMDGPITIDVKTQNAKDKDAITFLAKTVIDLQSEKQALNLNIGTDGDFNLKTKEMHGLTVGIEFLKVALLMPRLSKKSLPPQFMPDGRITNTPYNPKKDPEAKKESSDLDLKLQALGEKALHIKTNLIDELIRLNFDLNIFGGELKNGFIELLPLKTKVFKRPIEVAHLKINFKAPLEPVIETTVLFLLPEYKITMNLEGPVSNPRYAFSSVPPLPQSDIYAVLFFGRPLSDLDPDDKSAANRTNQILSQGILSLSVLYFFAGSPIEYVGYDPGSKNASAQIGLGSKNSLKIGGGAGGVNSTAVRRSLGKGWYLDTSVQKPSNLSTSEANNYGVLLERIIAY